ncbi:nucleosome assembly protein 1,4 [Tanacetum coccineum]
MWLFMIRISSSWLEPELRTLCLHLRGLHREDGCVKWLQELALRNAGIETFSFRDFCHRCDVKDVALLVKNCSKSLLSLNFSTSYIDDLGDAFSHAVKLECFWGALYREDMEYSSFRFPSTIRCLDISNEALECIGTNLKNLRALYLCVRKEEDDKETISPLDSGFRAMLIGCNKLERLSINLYEEGLTDVGLGFIGKYGIDLRFLSLGYIGGSVEGLRALSMGCPRKLELEGCDFSDQAIASFWFNVHSLRYIWVMDKDYEVVLVLTRPDFGSSTMEAQVLTELKPHVTLAKKNSID